MKKSKKFVLAGLVLLAAITMVLLPLSGCKTEVDTSSPQQEQPGDSTGNNDSTGTGENAGTGGNGSTGENAGTKDNTSGGGDSGMGGGDTGDNPSAGNGDSEEKPGSGESNTELQPCSHQPNEADEDCTTEVQCTVCGEVTVAAKSHDFTGEWQKDAESHWHDCKNEGCNKIDTKAAHFGGTATYTDKGDGTHAKTCVCGEELTEVHKFTYTDNEDGTHIGKCACGEEEVSRSHSFGEKGKCTECEYECLHTAVIECGYCTACNELLDSVDLGVDVKWATMNVGATKPEEYGDYFSWGETEPKEEYSWPLYKYYDDDGKATKYCVPSRTYGANYYGKDDGKTVLEPIDDAATANLGEAWRMPTEEEMTKLIEVGDWTWTTLNGVSGYEVKGSNNNSIFLPAAGYYQGDTFLDNKTAGKYRTSSLYTEAASAYSLMVSELIYEQSSHSRVYGYSVRPVCE